MTTEETRIKDLETRFGKRERLVFVRTLLLSAIPVLMAGILLWWTLLEIDDARTKRDEARAELTRTEALLSETRERLAATEEKLRKTQEELDRELQKSATYLENLYDMNWTELKSIASNSETYKILVEIDELRHQGVGWAARGATPTEGFNSPTFAVFVLQKIDRSLEGRSAIEVLRSLPPVPIEERRPGDIVVYEMGYCMFYFRDHEGTEFVIGMTPVGIAALKLHFGPRIIKVLRVD